MPAVRYFFSPEAWTTVSNFMFIGFGGLLVLAVLIALPEHISYKITKHDNVGKLLVIILIATGTFAALPILEALFASFTLQSFIGLVLFAVVLFFFLRMRSKPIVSNVHVTTVREDHN